MLTEAAAGAGALAAGAVSEPCCTLLVGIGPMMWALKCATWSLYLMFYAGFVLVTSDYYPNNTKYSSQTVRAARPSGAYSPSQAQFDMRNALLVVIPKNCLVALFCELLVLD